MIPSSLVYMPLRKRPEKSAQNTYKRSVFRPKKLSYPFEHNGIPDALKWKHLLPSPILPILRAGGGPLIFESQGIHTYVRDELTIQGTQLLSMPLANIRLRCLTAKKWQAIQLLAGIWL